MTQRAPYRYKGTELGLFGRAANWKRYWISKIRPYLVGEVLEVGAGIGNNTLRLQDAGHRHWTCVEPDAAMADQLREALRKEGLSARCEVITGDLSCVPPGKSFDVVLYIDVLEHIEHDAQEMLSAARRLGPEGRLVVLSPAHECLYSPFDKEIGHYRRYNRASLRALTPQGLEIERLAYLDSAGLLASTMNRILLQESLPTAGQIAIWDRWLIPVSVVLDRLFGFRIGKSILGVWRSKARGLAIAREERGEDRNDPDGNTTR